jgi:hypothetical protein
MVPTTSNQEISARRKSQFRSLISENKTYPLATITYHGPSPDYATKIVVGILPLKDQEPIIRAWLGDNIAEDTDTAREIAGFVHEHDIARVLTSEWVLSCPHEEGIDYPEDTLCPHCPDWH